MNHIFFKLRIIIFALIFPVFFLSCSNKLGYGVVNWSIPEYSLTAGDVIPIYVRSNIEKLYIVGLNEKSKVRVEIPLWQLSFFESKKEALKYQKRVEEYKYSYATVKLDGLPMRESPDNNSEPVYKLRENQKVKILWFGEGVPVLKKGKPMDGNWFKVLTEDGAKGWCFSYNLTIYDERESSGEIKMEISETKDEELDAVLAEFWYPEHYRKMINNKQVDLEKISLTWGFFPGVRSSVARVELDGLQLSFPYKKITKLNNKYQFEGANLSMQIRGKDIITLEFSDLKGKQRVENFVTLNATAEEVINNEIKRREDRIAKIANTSKEFVSENFGVLKILPDGQFIWSGYNLISPSIIPEGAGSSGKVYTKHFLSKQFLAEYDGTLSFKFEKESTPVHFMYNISKKGIRLEAVEASDIRNGIVERRSLNPVILFFAAK